MKSDIKNYIVSRKVQKIFVVLGLGAYVAQAGMALSIASQAYPGGTRFSPFFVLVLETTLLPPLLFGMAFFMNHDAHTRLWRAFQSTFFTVMAMFVMIVLGALVALLINQPIIVHGTLLWSALYQIAPILVVLVTYVVALNHFNKLKVEDNALPVVFQKAFIVLALSVFAAYAVQLLYRVLQQLATNQNLSAFFVGSLETILLPALLFILAYFASLEKKFSLSRMFESILFVTMGMLLYTALSAFFVYASQFSAAPQESYLQAISGSMIAMGATLAAYTVALIYRRRSLTD